MLNPPKTREEAKKYRYGKWAGAPKGYAYNEARCAYEIADSSRWNFYQCSRKPGYGPDGLYCKQHAKKMEGR